MTPTPQEVAFFGTLVLYALLIVAAILATRVFRP